MEYHIIKYDGSILTYLWCASSMTMDRLRMVVAFANVRHLLMDWIPYLRLRYCKIDWILYWQWIVYLRFDRSNTVLMGTVKEVASTRTIDWIMYWRWIVYLRFDRSNTVVCALRFVSKAPLLWSMDWIRYWRLRSANNIWYNVLYIGDQYFADWFQLTNLSTM